MPPITPAAPTPPTLSTLLIAGFLDAATGRAAQKNQGDYAAIATVGLDPAGYLYLLDLWLKRASPTQQITAIFDLHERWHYNLFGIETNCFQHLLLLPLEEERKRRKQNQPPDAFPAWQLPIREVHHAQAKETRIATLEPLLANGWLRFNDTLPDLFWAQLESFPSGDHDDALDATEAAIALLRGMQTASQRTGHRSSIKTLNHY